MVGFLHRVMSMFKQSFSLFSIHCNTNISENLRETKYLNTMAEENDFQLEELQHPPSLRWVYSNNLFVKLFCVLIKLLQSFLKITFYERKKLDVLNIILF
jgi:hypothetical protein